MEQRSPNTFSGKRMSEMRRNTQCRTSIPRENSAVCGEEGSPYTFIIEKKQEAKEAGVTFVREVK